MRLDKFESPDDPAAHIAAVNADARDDEYLHALLHHAAAESDRQVASKDTALRRASRITIGACVLAGIETLLFACSAAYLQLRPPPERQVLVVDKANGKTEQLVSLREYQMKPEEAQIRRYVATFIRCHEDYSLASAQDNYYDCAAFLSPPLRAQWEAAWDKNNPVSPLNVYKKEQRVHNELGAITLLRNRDGVFTGARATFKRITLRNEQPEGEPTEWMGTMAFDWVNVPTSERQRRVNDLGWQVTEYSRDPDASVARPQVAPSIAPPAGVGAPMPAASAASPVALTAPRGEQ